ncbi:hypothetical protein [Marinimicrobium agarilyticum]|uniref:hypothetical protein n=1 Tax=Marinimicrobium agarilyticum TaxID=306546 RepID=UPI0003F8E5A1|nr:hypothetical protein [Marinimicrobium agarilyticum]
MVKLKTPLTYLSVATLVALVGCGGSSGGGDNTPPPTTEPPVTEPGPVDEGSGVTLAGVATKGVLKNARVTAYELDDAGERLEGSVGSTETDGEGSYELELTSDYQGGPVEVEVTVVEGTTKMVCDASRCGDGERFSDIDLPVDFVLNAIVDKPVESDRIEAAVTAWSSMAAKRAKALIAEGGKDLAAARKQASAEVSQLVGFDIERTGSKGLSQISGASAEETQYAVMNAAVAELLFKEDGEVSLGEKLQKFTAALQDGSAGDADDSFNMANLSQAINDVINSSDGLDTDALDALSNQSAQYDAAGEAGFSPDYDEDLVVDENTTTEQKIAAYKSFVADARTWVSTLEATDTDSIAAAAEVDAEAIKASVDGKVQSQFQFVGEVLNQVGLFADANPEKLVALLNDGGSEPITITNTNGDTVGTAHIEATYDQGLVLSLSGTVAGDSGDAFAPFALALHTSITKGALEAFVTDDGQVSGLLNELAQNTELSLVGHVGDLSSDHFIQLRDLSVSVELANALQASEDGLFDADEADAAFRSAALSGGVTVFSAGNELTGDVEASMVRLNDDARLLGDYNSGPMNLERLRFTGDLQSADGRYAAGVTIAARLNNAASFDAFTWSDYSGARLAVNGEMTFSPIEALSTPVASDADATVVYYNDDWEGSYTPSIRDLYETGEPTSYFYVLDQESADALRETLAANVRDALPEVVTLRYYDYSISDYQEFDYNLTGFKTDAVLKSLDTFWVEGDLSVSLNLAEVVDIPGNDYQYYTVVPLSDNILSGSLDKNGYERGTSLTLDLADADLLNDVAAAFQAQTNRVGDDLHAFYLSTNNGGYYDVRNIDTDEYNLCLADREAYVNHRYGDTQFPTVMPGCAEFALKGEGIEGDPLAEADAELLEQGVIDGIQQRLSLNDTQMQELNVTSIRASASTEVSGGGFWADMYLPDLETADNFLKGSVTVSARLALPELPEARLTATFNRSAYEGGMVRINTDWDGGNYTLEASGDMAESESLDLRLFNPQGYELKLNASTNEAGEPIITGEALIDGEVIGTVESRDGVPVIVYPNGDANEVESLI